mgnify:CR=1 FL=1
MNRSRFAVKKEDAMEDKQPKSGFIGKLSTFIVDKRNLFFLLYIFAFIFCVFSMGWVQVENDVTKYLPYETETRQGIEAMNAYFESFGTAQVMVHNVTYETAEEISAAIGATGENDVALTLRRGDETIETTVSKRYDEASGRYLMGITFGTERVRMGFFKAVGNSFAYCAELLKTMIQTLGQMFTNKAVMDSVAGPVGTVSLVTELSRSSFEQSFAEGMTMVINLLVIISMNLGLMNLLPLPALDGGRAVLLVVETVTGKHLSRKAESIVHFAGLILLLGLIVLITGRDILRLFGVNI